MSKIPQEVMDSPSLIRHTILGKEYLFWFCLRGQEIAKNKHDYDPSSIEMGDNATLDQTFRFLWIGHLPFNEGLSFEDFHAILTWAPTAELVALTQQIKKVQTPPEAKGSKNKSRKPGKSRK